MDKRLEVQLFDLRRFDFQRKAWLVLSAFVMAALVFVIFDRKHLIEYGLLWQIGILAIIVSSVWWYWAMRLINQLIQHRIAELQVLSDLHETLVIVKKEFVDSSPNNID
jgi:hypothetical protein